MSIMNDMSLNFIIPENDINYRLMRLLVLTETLSFSSKGNAVLTIEKITLFDFLIKYPNLLKEVLSMKNIEINILSREKGSIETLFPNKMLLFDFSSIKLLLNILLAYDFIDVQIIKNEIYYCISNKGKSFISDLGSEDINRVKDLSLYLLPLRSTKVSELKKIVNPLVKGV